MPCRRSGRLALTLCGLLLLAACSRSQEAGETLVTIEVMEAYPAALIEGILQLTAVDGRACWTVSLPDSGDTYLLVLPDGTQMSDDDALQVADSDQWLHAGDQVRLGGGEWHDAVYRDFESVCDATGLWLVSPGDITS